WQYTSEDPETGLREFSCGPASNEHASGWPPGVTLPMHKYLNVTGGYLSFEVDRPEGRPTLTARFHDVDGNVLYTEAFRAE
ncbi:MAG: alkaline phosphatase, partial [Candidatus Hydrogenedens sp.]|nr:alkaline phosphatase [Candidatus Hydrogenedens sp.]